MHEGEHDAEAVDDLFVEGGRSGEAGREFNVENVILEAEQIGGGMISGESAWDAREPIAL